MYSADWDCSILLNYIMPRRRIRMITSICSSSLLSALIAAVSKAENIEAALLKHGLMVFSTQGLQLRARAMLAALRLFRRHFGELLGLSYPRS